MSKITSFLMIQGQAEEAITFYTETFKDSEIIRLIRYGVVGQGKEGEVSQAAFSINGQEFICTDSIAQHAFTFMPSISLLVECDMEEEIDDVFAKLSEGGDLLIPLDNYPFSKKFGWFQDKIGIYWQLTLNN